MVEFTELGNNTIFVLNAGKGETPICPQAIFKRGDVVKIRNKKSLSHFPREAIIAVAIPPGFSPDYALADLLGEPRPLMIREGKRCVSYILVNEGDETPYIARESDLLPSGKPPIEIGTFLAHQLTTHRGVTKMHYHNISIHICQTIQLKLKGSHAQTTITGSISENSLLATVS